MGSNPRLKDRAGRRRMNFYGWLAVLLNFLMVHWWRQIQEIQNENNSPPPQNLRAQV
jgi:hypothetical protein